jgi:hypothetical protein
MQDWFEKFDLLIVWSDISIDISDSFGWVHHVSCMHERLHPVAAGCNEKMIYHDMTIWCMQNKSKWEKFANIRHLFFPFALRWIVLAWAKILRLQCTLRAQSAWTNAGFSCWRPQLFSKFCTAEECIKVVSMTEFELARMNISQLHGIYLML